MGSSRGVRSKVLWPSRFSEGGEKAEFTFKFFKHLGTQYQRLNFNLDIKVKILLGNKFH
jgi:hypothetical protein